MPKHKRSLTPSIEDGADGSLEPFAPRTLPFDILTYLLFYLPRTRDVSRMAQTCRTLFTLGIQEMLRRTPLRVDSGDSKRTLRSVLLFITADNGARLPAVQELDARAWLYKEPEKEFNFDLLLDIIHQSLHLKVLRVRGFINLLDLEGDKSIFEAISRLEYLEELQLDVYTRQAAAAVAAVLDLIPGWCTNLKGITLGFFRFSLLQTISAFISQLTNARIPTPGCNPFRFVTALFVELHWKDSGQFLSDSVNAFPNVRHLTMLETTLDNTNDAESIRSRNREALTQKCWPSLDSFSARGAAPLYALGLTCPVRQWRVGCNMGNFRKWDADVVLLSLKELSVKQLEINLAMTMYMGARGATKRLIKGFSTQALPCLTHVRFITRVDWDIGLSVTEVIFAATKAVVANLGLIYIEIQFTIPESKSPQRQLFQGEQQDAHETTYRYIRDLDLLRFASLWFRASPTLQFVVFTASVDIEDGEARLARITAYQRQDRGVVPIGEDAALRICRMEWETSADMRL